MEKLKTAVCEVNQRLVSAGLVSQTWGNASAIDRAEGLVVIKPSGISYESLRPERMCVVDLGGTPLEGELRPSVDLETHLVLYKVFPEIGGIVHTHSHFATCWAQARKPIPCLGTTHADYFYGEIPVTDVLTEVEVEGEYEYHTGKVIARRFADRDPLACPGILVPGHGPFTWGKTLEDALEHAIVLEEVAKLAWHTLALNPVAQPLEHYAIEKHFLRKHGAAAYYGQ